MKKFLLRRFLLVAVALALPLALKAASGSDRLYEVNLAEFPKYRALLLSKLGPTPFDCGRVTVQPAFAPEYSVSVYSRSLPRGELKYFVTYAAADQSLWEKSDAGRNSEGAEHTKIRLMDCEIPKEIAEKVKQAWLGMLTGNQHPTPMRQEDAARATDATIAEFSIQVSPAQTLYGEIPTQLPAGPRTKALLDLSKSLSDYCKTEPADRPALASKIDQGAARLLADLK
jgi:hypothetical protein